MQGSGYAAREINRAALKHWQIVASYLYDMKGCPLGEVQRLNPNYVAQDPSRARPPGTPRLTELRGPSMHDDGSWHCLGGAGAHGNSVISLVAYLGQCDERTAGDWLKSLCNRLVEIAA